MKSHVEEVIQSVSGNSERIQSISRTTPKTIGTIDKVFAFILCCIFLSFALAVGIISARPFHWPFNWDPLRDIGIAQTIIDGNYPDDPILKGEVNWYNPLTGAMIAFFSYFLDTPLPETCMRIGPFLQLLLPVSVLLFAWNRWGPWAGFLGLVYVIFARHPYLPEWMYTTYSPWLIAPQWGKTFFFLTLLMFILFVEKRKRKYSFLSGLFLGLGFLTHTAILVEAGLIIVIYAIDHLIYLYKYSDKKEINYFVKDIGFLFVTALIISSAYWLPIFIRYQFIIRNPYPSLYVTTPLEWGKLPNTLLKSANGFTVIGVVSILFLFIHRKKEELWWLRIWALAVVLLVIQQLLCQFLHTHGHIIPSFFPPHHVFMSAHALIGFWFIYGVLQLANSFVRFLQQRNVHLFLQKGSYILILSMVFLIGISTLVKPIPPISELYRGREEKQLIYEVMKYDKVYHWILNNTLPEDVFLSDEVTGIWTAMPAGRKVIYVMMLYMNPYCELGDRMAFLTYLWNSLQEERFSDFLTYCKQQGINYILLRQDDEHKHHIDMMKKITLCYQDPEVVVYKIP